MLRQKNAGSSFKRFLLLSMPILSKLAQQASSRLKNLHCLVGNTPLLVIYYAYNGKRRTIYAKAENHNLTGSIKDRMALHILLKAYQQGQINPGDLIAEATSGNTGISFCAIGRALGHPVKIFMPDWMSRERILLIQSMGAQIALVSKAEGGFVGSIRLAEELASREPGVFLPRQFSNEANVEAHRETTGPEIWAQLESENLKPDAFVAGVGTGGTIMGAGQYLRSKNPKVRIHPLEPAESPTLSTGCKVGGHRIQGISDEFIPPILKLEDLDRVVNVHDGDAILMAQKLSQQLGLGVGISSGANFLGALEIQNELGDDIVAVTVFADDNKKYLSTDLLHDEPAADHYVAPRVQLLGYDSISRIPAPHAAHGQIFC
jgi:cysteine synthase